MLGSYKAIPLGIKHMFLTIRRRGLLMMKYTKKTTHASIITSLGRA